MIGTLLFIFWKITQMKLLFLIPDQIAMKSLMGLKKLLINIQHTLFTLQ